jgi:hypothetical protein
MAKWNSKDEAKKDERNPEYEGFQRILKQVLSVPPKELDKRKAKRERERKEKRAG